MSNSKPTVGLEGIPDTHNGYKPQQMSMSELVSPTGGKKLLAGSG